MNKLKNFCKKPLLIASICLTAVFFIAVIIMICIPHGKVYQASYTKNGVEYSYKITLDKKYKSSYTQINNGIASDVSSFDKKEYDYVVDNGELFIIDGGTSKEKQKIANINSRVIKLNFNVFGEEDNTVLTCKPNRILTNIFVVGLYSSICLIIVSVVFISVDKYKAKNNLKSDKN